MRVRAMVLAMLAIVPCLLFWLCISRFGAGFGLEFHLVGGRRKGNGRREVSKDFSYLVLLSQAGRSLPTWPMLVKYLNAPLPVALCCVKVSRPKYPSGNYTSTY
uniref:Uncharacterized protein n=1 Tax=Setaria viridis TaxID=4556 RepID=A0A4U6UPU2_SETVI|nr:hypothetical protein SEVIR_5G425500v2 [Setaria viridis]